MKPLNLKETELKEEMKEKCLAKGQYIDEKAKEKFNMLCHLEDFEVQYWELLKENKILIKNAENNDKVVDKVNWENQLLKKENEQLKKQLEEYKNPIKYFKYANKNVTEENKQLKDNWNKLKEYLKNRYDNGTESISYRQVFMEIREAMQVLEIAQELERSDSNE